MGHYHRLGQTPDPGVRRPSQREQYRVPPGLIHYIMHWDKTWVPIVNHQPECLGNPVGKGQGKGVIPLQGEMAQVEGDTRGKGVNPLPRMIDSAGSTGQDKGVSPLPEESRPAMSKGGEKGGGPSSEGGLSTGSTARGKGVVQAHRGWNSQTMEQKDAKAKGTAGPGSAGPPGSAASEEEDGSGPMNKCAYGRGRMASMVNFVRGLNLAVPSRVHFEQGDALDEKAIVQVARILVKTEKPQPLADIRFIKGAVEARDPIQGERVEEMRKKIVAQFTGTVFDTTTGGDLPSDAHLERPKSS